MVSVESKERRRIEIHQYVMGSSPVRQMVKLDVSSAGRATE